MHALTCAYGSHLRTLILKVVQNRSASSQCIVNQNHASRPDKLKAQLVVCIIVELISISKGKIKVMLAVDLHMHTQGVTNTCRMLAANPADLIKCSRQAT